jgi:lipopolysaccharide transport system permease protein
MMTALGVSLWLSAMNVQFRDVRYMIPFITQAWLFATPVAYPSSMLSEPWRTTLRDQSHGGGGGGISLGAPGHGYCTRSDDDHFVRSRLLILISGVYYFRRMEKNFADVI